MESTVMNSSIVSMPAKKDTLIFKGRDRAKTLHNLCTNDILRSGQGDCLEAFITSLQGKVLGFVEIVVLEDSIYIVSNEKGLELCRDHIKKYSIFDETEVIEPAQELFSLFVHGKNAIEQLSEMADLSFVSENRKCKKYDFDKQEVIVKPSFLAGSVELIGNHIVISDISEKLKTTQLTPDQFELIRIAAAWPLSGIDTSADNLPQEIDRDKTAISFKKGCYLGQETVARLDALGHVNRKLVGVSFKSAEDNLNSLKNLPIQVVNKDNQQVGEIRSLAYDPENRQYLGLAMMRLKALESETRIAVAPEINLIFQSLEIFREEAGSLLQSELNI